MINKKNNSSIDWWDGMDYVSLNIKRAIHNINNDFGDIESIIVILKEVYNTDVKNDGSYKSMYQIFGECNKNVMTGKVNMKAINEIITGELQ